MLQSEKFKNFIKLTVSFLTIGGLLYYLWTHWGIFSSVLDASWYHIAFLVLCIFASWAVHSYQIIVILEQFGVKISFLENTALLISMRLGNYLPMKAGSILRIQYYKKVHGLEYLGFTGMMGVMFLVIVITTGILGLIAMLGISDQLPAKTVNIFYLFFSGMIICSIIFIIFPINKIRLPQNKIADTISNQLKGVLSIRSSPQILTQLILLGILQMILTTVRLYLSFDTIQIEMSPWFLLFIASLTSLLTFVSFTPGNLGLREWIIGLITVIIGLNVENGIFAGTVDRAVLIAVTFIFGIISIIYMKNRIKQHMVNKI